MSLKWSLEELQRKGYQVSGASAVKTVKENRKVKGAKKQKVDGVDYGSKLELYMANLLKAFKVPFLFQVPYTVQDGFHYRGKKIQDIQLIVDFYLPDQDIWLDTKGHQTPDNKLKWKMMKHKLVSEGKEPRIELPSTKEECEKLINQLISKS